MISFKACPRCKGDLFSDRDRYGQFLCCTQCGYHRDIDPDPPRRKFRAWPARHRRGPPLKVFC